MTLNIIVPLYICTFWFRNRFDDEMIQNLSFALGLAQVWTLFSTEALDKAIEFELVLVEGEHITDFEASPISERLWFFDWGRILNDFDLVMLFLLLSWGLVDPARPVLELAYNDKNTLEWNRSEKMSNFEVSLGFLSISINVLGVDRTQIIY